MVPGGGVAAVEPDRAEEVDPGEVALVAGEVDDAEAGNRLGLQRGRRVLRVRDLAEELRGLGVVLEVPRDLGGERLHVGVAGTCVEEARPVLRLVFGEPQLDSRLAVHGQEVRAETDMVVVVAGCRVGHRTRRVVFVQRRVARRHCGMPARDRVVPAAVERVAVYERGRLRRAVRHLRLLQHEVVEER